MSRQYFTVKTFGFLAALAQNNDRQWFEEHTLEYEDVMRIPALEFIGDLSEVMRRSRGISRRRRGRSAVP